MLPSGGDEENIVFNYTVKNKESSGSAEWKGWISYSSILSGVPQLR